MGQLIFKFVVIYWRNYYLHIINVSIDVFWERKYVFFQNGSEVNRKNWFHRVPVYSRNWHDLVFRVVEIGVALWFPCVLWNCMSPAELWILNPRKLISHLEPEPKSSETDGDAKVGVFTSTKRPFLTIFNCSQDLAPEKRKLRSTSRIVGFVTIRRKMIPLFSPVNAQAMFQVCIMNVSSGGWWKWVNYLFF